MALGEILAGAGSLFNSFSSFLGQSQSKSLMRYQAKLNQEAIDRQNVYNSPIEQVKRLREAGLNENLAFGNGVTGNQSSAPNVGIANRNPQLDTGLLDAVKTYFQRKQLENETRQTDANTFLAAANAGLATARRYREMQNAALFDKTLDIQVEKAKADLDYTHQAMLESKQRIDESRQRVWNLSSQANLLQEQIKYWEAHAQNERDFMPDLLRARTWQAMKSGDLSEAQVEVAHSVAALNNKKIDQLVSLIRKIDIEAGEEAIEYEIAQGMQQIGLSGIKPRDLLTLIKQLLVGGNK